MFCHLFCPNRDVGCVEFRGCFFNRARSMALVAGTIFWQRAARGAVVESHLPRTGKYRPHLRAHEMFAPGVIHALGVR